MAIARAVLVALAVCASGAVAHAQATGGNIDLGSFRPAIDSRGYLTVNASQVLGDKDVSFGLGALDWGRDLLHFTGAGNTTYSVDNIVTATLIGAFGLKLGPAELELGASVPLTIMNGDRGPDVIDPMNANNDNLFHFDGQGVGNVGLHFKTRFIKSSRPPHIGLGLIVNVYLPSTDPNDKFLGENKVVPDAQLILDKEFGKTQRFRISLNGGIRLRSSSTFTDMGAPGGAPGTGKTIEAGSELPVGLGLAYAISKQKFDVVAEVFGAIPIGDHQNYFPMEALGGVKLYLARNSFLSLGAGRGLATSYGGNPDFRGMIGIVFEPNIGDRDGDGIKDDVDKCPDEPEDFDGFQDEDGCPDPDNDRDGIPDVDDKCPNVPGPKTSDGCPEGNKNDRDGDGIPDDVDKCPDEPEDFDGFQDADGCPDPDNDNDGIPDVDDLCPNDPEDKDGFEDADGCPDPDNDHDRILDKDDKCPNEPETYNGYQDADGCPDRGKTAIVGGIMVILDPINFEYNKAVITRGSFPILDAVVATMQGNPDLALVEVQGHTDERGDDAYNLELSDRRAAAVVTYLVAHGVAEKRLSSQGYGETQPIDKRHNEAAWAKNRRVEFHILKRDGAP